MIKVRNLKKSFGVLEVLKNVDFEISAGEMVAITGASGAGKTTLLQILGTLDKPDSGEVEILGETVSALKENALAQFRNLHIGFVFQFHQLLPEFSALENVQIPALIAGKSFSQAEKEALEWLKFLGLENRKSHKPSALSGGEKQRVAVARALINKPELILADEPSGSLDTKNKEELHRLFFDLRANFGQTLVIVTHDEEFAATCQRTIKMQDGRIL